MIDKCNKVFQILIFYDKVSTICWLISIYHFWDIA